MKVWSCKYRRLHRLAAALAPERSVTSAGKAWSNKMPASTQGRAAPPASGPAVAPHAGRKLKEGWPGPTRSLPLGR